MLQDMNLNLSASANDLASGGFRHVQHVRPNRGPTKRGSHKKSPHKRSARGAANFLQHSNMPEIMGDTRVNE